MGISFRATQTSKPEVNPIEITPAEARQFLEKFLPAWKRDLSATAVKKLASVMEKGRFHDASVLYRVKYPDGTYHLLSGQHRLAAQIKSNTTQSYMMLDKSVDNVDEAREYYSTLDTNKPLLRGDSLKALGVGEKFELNTSELTRLGMAITTLYQDIKHDKTNIDPQELMMVIKKNKYDMLYKNMSEIFASSDKKLKNIFLKRSAITACSLVVLSEDPVKSSEFLREIALEKGELDTPTNSLRHFLIETRSSGGGDRTSDVSSGEARYVHVRAFALAYNRWLEQKALKRTELRGEVLRRNKNSGHFKLGEWLV
jgi:hypothetical protein